LKCTESSYAFILPSGCLCQHLHRLIPPRWHFFSPFIHPKLSAGTTERQALCLRTFSLGNNCTLYETSAQILSGISHIVTFTLRQTYVCILNNIHLFEKNRLCAYRVACTTLASLTWNRVFQNSLPCTFHYWHCPQSNLYKIWETKKKQRHFLCSELWLPQPVHVITDMLGFPGKPRSCSRSVGISPFCRSPVSPRLKVASDSCWFQVILAFLLFSLTSAPITFCSSHQMQRTCPAPL
jgi:hypothetical protein